MHRRLSRYCDKRDPHLNTGASFVNQEYVLNGEFFLTNFLINRIKFISELLSLRSSEMNSLCVHGFSS